MRDVLLHKGQVLDVMAAFTAVRDLHAPMPDDPGLCSDCADDQGPDWWPCPTAELVYTQAEMDFCAWLAAERRAYLLWLRAERKHTMWLANEPYRRSTYPYAPMPPHYGNPDPERVAFRERLARYSQPTPDLPPVA